MPSIPAVTFDISGSGAVAPAFNENRGVYTIKSPSSGTLTIAANTCSLIDTVVDVTVPVGHRLDFIPDSAIGGLTASAALPASWTSGTLQSIQIKFINPSGSNETLTNDEFIGYLTVSEVIEPKTTITP